MNYLEKNFTTILILHFLQGLCDKWNFMKEEERKKFEKKKDFKNVEQKKYNPHTGMIKIFLLVFQ